MQLAEPKNVSKTNPILLQIRFDHIAQSTCRDITRFAILVIQFAQIYTKSKMWNPRWIVQQLKPPIFQSTFKI